MRSVPRFPVVLIAVVALLAAHFPRTAAAATPLAGLGDGLGGIDLTRGLHLLPRGQLDDPLSFLPSGSLGNDTIDWPIAIGQGLASAAISVSGAILFTKLGTPAAGATQSQVKNNLIGYSLLELATLPLLSGTAVYFIGNADAYHDVGFGWPLAANYVAELILIGIKIGVDLGAAQGLDQAKDASELLGKYGVVDYILHAIVVPVTTTYFSIRSREPKGLSLSVNERPSAINVASVRPVFASVASAHEAASLVAATPVVTSVPLVAARF
jgi:hypothetical protein